MRAELFILNEIINKLVKRYMSVFNNEFIVSDMIIQAIDGAAWKSVFCWQQDIQHRLGGFLLLLASYAGAPWWPDVCLGTTGDLQSAGATTCRGFRTALCHPRHCRPVASVQKTSYRKGTMCMPQ
ncbi:hypothetical protein CEXT_345871 [Caerostris extrusa]|uniref:Uncharacterized protein n=1 Tax=Caerostris extrusa TaxID=172846 RepID=A0AAV4TDB8_CAEEX|nr:hypothetical protein CEXT_345871 [Caerostris extrusa]